MNFIRSAPGARLPAQTASLGIVSDTHGLLRPEVRSALAGCDGIIHVGDLGGHGVYDDLSRVAPTVAIRGNVDQGSWAEAFAETLALSVAGVNLYVLHDLHALAFDPRDERVDVVISGHSHRPAIKEEAGILYVNPGSAGPRRFSLPITVARLKIGLVGLEVELVDLMRDTPIAALKLPRRLRST